jgi:hypothetical protein
VSSQIQNVWQKQETEKTAMSIVELRRNAKRLLRRKQRDLIARSAFVLLAAVACGLFLMNARLTSLRFTAVLVSGVLLANTVWRLLRAYQRSRESGTSVYAAASAAMTPCLEFYRSELERMQEFARVPAWQLVAVLLIIAWMTRDALRRNSADPFQVVLPYVLIAAGGLIVLMGVRKYQARRVQADMDALDLLEQGGSDGAAIDDNPK